MTPEDKVFCLHLKDAYKVKGDFGHEGRRMGSVCQPQFFFISTLISTSKTMNKLIKVVTPFELPVILVAFPTGQFFKVKDSVSPGASH